MCGIAGFFAQDARPSLETRAVAQAMALEIIRRGPDDSGIEICDDGRLALAFRRLAIIDLTAEGHQPMRSPCGRWTIVFNGEIYNFRQIRDRLVAEGHELRPRGHSDTEILLEAVAAWGLETALKRFNGMFAFALWDDLEKTLHLARDRFGEKPLYLGWCNSTFLFGSELKALAAHPRFFGEIDRDALADFLRLGYVPAPRSIFRGIGKLEPGTFISLDSAARANREIPEPTAYWSAREAALVSLRNPFQGTDSQAIDALDAALRTAVSQRTFADVPVGAFLSGGIDSSAIVALMQATSSGPVRTFTIGNTEAAYDESEFSAAVARHLGTQHEVWTVTTRDALDIIPRLPDYYCEPFADSSQIPTILVARAASAHVKVVLSGDGGDELFGGYTRHVTAQKTSAWAARLPSSLRAFIGGALERAPTAGWDILLRSAGRFTPSLQGRKLTSAHIRTLAAILGDAPGRQIYDGLVSAGPQGASLALGSRAPLGDAPGNAMPDLLHEMMFLDTISYLPDDIMVKVDRATMGESIEGRAPFLDPDLFALAWSLPAHLVTDGRRGKLALRQVLARYVPEHLFERPKQGFAIPIASWLRADLAPWAESLLEETRLRADGYLDAGTVRLLWDRHKAGEPGRERALWHVLMFQAWLERWRGKIHAPACGQIA